MPDSHIYCFADVEVDALRSNLKRGGEERHLRQKNFQVLLYLIEHRGSNISKSELIKDIWKGTSVVDDVLVQSIKDIRRALGDNPQHPQFIKTIPKIGYRFIGEVKSPVEKPEEFTLKPGTIENKSESSNLKSKIRNRAAALAVFLAAVVCIISGSVLQSVRQAENKNLLVSLPNHSDKKSLAVMFFENQSSDAELDWLREGLADMLITDLSRSSKLQILSREQLRILFERTKSDPATNISLDEAFEIARRGGAEIVMTGRFARLGDKVRIEVQLYDVQAGRLRAAENLIVETPQQILTEISTFSRKLENRLGSGDAQPERSVVLFETMTNDLKAYRFYSLGVEQAEAFHNQAAIELFEKAISLDPKFAMAHARIGYAYAVTWDLKDKGKPYLEKAFQLSDRLSEKDRLNIMAWYAIANLDFQNAIEQLRRFIAKYPLEIEAYRRLARLLQGEGKPEEAINVLKLGLAIDPEAKNLYNSVGYIQSNLGNHDEAIKAHQRYVELSPNEPNAYDSLGATYQWAGNYESAIASYDRALELNPNFDIAIIHLANARFQLGQYREAIELYRRYISNAPSDVERARGYSSLAFVYLKKQDYKAAWKAAEETLKLQRDWTWIPYIIALKRGDSADAKRLENRIFSNLNAADRGSKSSRRPEFYHRGYIALKNGAIEEAIANFQEAVHQLPQTWQMDAFEDCLANAYLTSNRLDEALIEYERILRLNPNYPLAHFHLAQIHERRGENDNARESYQKFLQVWQNADRDIPEVTVAQSFLLKNK